MPTSRDESLFTEIHRLVTECLEGVADAATVERLDRLVAGGPQARALYLEYLRDSIGLRYIVLPAGEAPTDTGVSAADADADVRAHPAVGLFPHVSLPALHSRDGIWPSATGYFSSGWPVAYMVAMVVFGIGLAIGALVHVSQPLYVAAKGPLILNAPKMESVGRITGAVDCVWADAIQTVDLASVAPGSKFALASGFLEITYDSGAKVILQGACTYEVESMAGGFLSLGKLTARIENRASSVESRHEASNHQSEVQNRKSPLSPLSSPLFSVRTPTAVVTDLGTEFGVEVGPAGDTLSHVFRGSVSVRLVGGHDRWQEVVLRENESARAEKGEGGGDGRLTRVGTTSHPPAFVRQLTALPKELDLLDIVAGGNGRGHRRERGIDPATGQEDPSFAVQKRLSDQQYHRVTWHRLIDGVFVPSARTGDRPVQLDSAGHTFDRFPWVSGRSFGSIWARAAEVRQPELAKNNLYWVYALGRGEQFMPQRRGLLGMNSNAGITFDLETIRRSQPGVVPCRFRAVAGVAESQSGNPSVHGAADIRIFVDGRLKFQRTDLRPRDRTLALDVALKPTDRFLTIVVTEGSDQINGDWVVFGGPVLETTSRQGTLDER
jgi:hypothetical protein